MLFIFVTLSLCHFKGFAKSSILYINSSIYIYNFNYIYIGLSIPTSSDILIFAKSDNVTT